MIVVLALVLRLVWLDVKPPHFDEGVNGLFVDTMTAEGYYHYDAGNFHGPLHFYILFLAQTLLGRDPWVLRLPIALASTLCVAMFFAFRRDLGNGACLIAAAAAAISPGMVFYGRYAIHETWLLLFLLLSAWGLLGIARGLLTLGAWSGDRRHLAALIGGCAGMVLTKETYVIHVGVFVIAIACTVALDLVSRPASETAAARTWGRRDVAGYTALALGVVLFFYSGAFLDWPDWSRPAGQRGSVAGLWETFQIWTQTGTDKEGGHAKEWHYWLELMLRYETAAVLGLLAMAVILPPRQSAPLRWLAAVGFGTWLAYSIISYKTPWCIIVILWPMFMFFGVGVVWLAQTLDRAVASILASVVFAFGLANTALLNFANYADEEEPYVYVQTLRDVEKLMSPLHTLVRQSPANYHLRGLVLISQDGSHPLPWWLGDFTRLAFLSEREPIPEQMDADFLVIEDPYVSDVEERLKDVYFREAMVVRGNSAQATTLYFQAERFASLFPGREPEFRPEDVAAAKAKEGQ